MEDGIEPSIGSFFYKLKLRTTTIVLKLGSDRPVEPETGPV